MLETKQQARSPALIDTDTTAEGLHFVRSAIAATDHTTAHPIAAVLKEVCQNGSADRAAIWADLTYSQRQ